MTNISPLRQRFIDDMNLAGFAESTQASYIRIIAAFVQRCGNVSPEKMTEQQVENYLRDRLKYVARGTFQAEFGALRFLFCNTLLVDWAIFTKKKVKWPLRFRLPVAKSHEDCQRLITTLKNPIYHACLALMYACGLRIGDAIKLPVSAVDSMILQRSFVDSLEIIAHNSAT